MTQAPNYPVPALEKGLDILEALAAAATPLSLAELSLYLERRSGELFRMLNCLERRRYLARDAVSGKYELSLKVFSLAHGHAVTEKLLRFAWGPMQALTERTRESCHLGVLDRDRLLVLAQAESPEPVRISIEVGGRFDPAVTASGRMLLADLPEDARAECLEKSESARGHAPAERRAFLATLDQVRRDRFSAAIGESVEGVRDLAVPLGSGLHGLSAALTVTRLHRRAPAGSEEDLVAEMRACARTINETAGFNS